MLNYTTCKQLYDSFIVVIFFNTLIISYNPFISYLFIFDVT